MSNLAFTSCVPLVCQLRLSQQPGLLHRDLQLQSSQTRLTVPTCRQPSSGWRAQAPLPTGESAPSGVSRGLTSPVESSACPGSSLALLFTALMTVVRDRILPGLSLLAFKMGPVTLLDSYQGSRELVQKARLYHTGNPCQTETRDPVPRSPCPPLPALPHTSVKQGWVRGRRSCV